ncbi:hypothetical protein JTP77_011695 [Streptomyces sp. S9]|nr:hypothetical protein [Streptomyces sp. S9]
MLATAGQETAVLALPAGALDQDAALVQDDGLGRIADGRGNVFSHSKLPHVIGRWLFSVQSYRVAVTLASLLMGA